MKYLKNDNNGIHWVENMDGMVFGVVSADVITDEIGIPFYSEQVLDVLDRYGFELTQDWDNEETYIEFTCENGEVERLVFGMGYVKHLDNDQVAAL